MRTPPVDINQNVSQLAGEGKTREVFLQLPSLHPHQYRIREALDNSDVRFVAGACGTKFGKTYGCSIIFVQEAWNAPDSLNWWVAPTYAHAKMGYRLVRRLLPKGTYQEYKADLRIVLIRPDGSEHSVMEFKSADNESSLRGFGVKFFVLDEAARCSYESYVSLMTTVTQTRGRGILISTPKGRGWFYDIYQRGDKSGLMPGEVDEWLEWISIRMPTWANPYVPVESVREMKKNLPEDVFQQEVAAQFLFDSAGVFRGIQDCIRGVLERPIPGHSYVMGVDLARLRDFTVLTVIDRARRNVVAFERFNQLAWEVQYYRIIEMAKRYRAVVYMDSTGVGDPVVEAIQNAGVRVEPYQIGGTAAKTQLIDKLRVNIENERISFPHIPPLVKELQIYEYAISKSGVVKFSAPRGMHDDTVLSLALANWGADQAPFVYRHFNARGV